MNPKFGPLDPAEVADLEARRTWVRNHYDESARHAYDTLEGKLRLLDTILQNQWVAPAETIKLQALGVTFGDALAQMLGLTWTAVEDEHGRDPALTLVGTSLCVFPLTSISKRIERGEAVEIYGMFERACDAIEQAQRKGA